MAEERVLREASFDRSVRHYWLLSGTIILPLTCIGLPLLPFWLLLGLYFTGRYLESMSCQLTDRSLKVKKGFINRVEKTVPLDKITDLALHQNFIMRWFGLEKLAAETAGQSFEGAVVSLTGVVDARAFRDAVLAQRDAVVANPAGAADVSSPAAADVPGGAGGSQEAVLAELRVIGRHVEEIARRLSDDSRSSE